MGKSKSTKTTAEVIEESAITICKPSTEIPTVWDLTDEPSWDRARALAAEVRRSAAVIVHLGMEIAALREQWFKQGSRTDLAGNSYHTANVTRGWEAKVEEELGICHRTALRIMERASTVIMIRQLQAGESVKWVTNREQEERVIEPTPELQNMAAQALEQVVAGTIAAGRAWAGLIGESQRRTSQGGVAARANVDHARNLQRAIRALKTSLKHWKHIKGPDRLELEREWKAVVSLLPETMRP